MPPFCSAPSRSSATRIFPSYWTVAALPFCNRTRAAKCSFDSARAAWADIVQLSRPSPTSYFRQTPLSRVLECRRVRPHPSPRRRIRPHWGKATFSTSKLNAGAHSISAHYKGSRNFAVSTSKAVSEKVNQVKTTTLNSSSNPATHGERDSRPSHCYPRTERSSWAPRASPPQHTKRRSPNPT